jgi:hypothetical protein
VILFISNLLLELHLQWSGGAGSEEQVGENEYFSDFFNSESDYEQTMEQEEDEFFENKKRKRFPFKKQSTGGGGGGEIHHHLGKFVLQKLSTTTHLNDDTCEILKIPEDPIPVPWCKTIEPFMEWDTVQRDGSTIHVKKKTKDEGILVESIPKFNFSSLSCSFDAILIHSNYKTIQQLKQLPLDKNYLIKRGYIFIWIEKENISEIMNYFEKINFIYVENMVWVKKELNNQHSSFLKRIMKKLKSWTLDIREIQTLCLILKNQWSLFIPLWRHSYLLLNRIIFHSWSCIPVNPLKRGRIGFLFDKKNKHL